MAIYQFVVELLPSDWVEKNKVEAVKHLYVDTNEYDTSLAWGSYSLPSIFYSLVPEILQAGESWDNDLKLWGSSEKHDIQLWTEDENVESIKIRFDLRENIDELKAKIINLASSIKCNIFVPESRNIINANINELNKEIEKSRAFRFTHDAEKFLNDVGGK